MIAILEGPDAGGKTTLARALQERYAAGYQHAGPPFDGATPASLTRYYAGMVTGLVAPPPLVYPDLPHLEMTSDQRARYEDMRTRSPLEAARPQKLAMGSSIIDRWALGEMVYGPLFRGRSLIGKEAWTALSCLLDATNTPLIVCLPPKSVVMETWRGRLDQEHFKDPLAIGKVYDAYATFTYGGNAALRSCRWSLVYDYTRAGALDELLRLLDALAEKQ